MKQHLCPTGRFLHVPPATPDSDWDTQGFSKPWWDDYERYGIGKLTESVREIRIINMLTKHDDNLEVCSEETINEILDRYLEINMHAASYTWKRLGKTLDMGKNLAQNGIPDERTELTALNMPHDVYVPAVHLYFNDDLTIA